MKGLCKPYDTLKLYYYYYHLVNQNINTIKHYINLFNIPFPFCHHAIFFKCVFVYKDIEGKGKLKTHKLLSQVFLSVFYVLAVRKEKGQEMCSLPLTHNNIISLRKQEKHLKPPWKIMRKKVLKCPRNLVSWDLEMILWLTDGCDFGGSGKVPLQLVPTWYLVEKQDSYLLRGENCLNAFLNNTMTTVNSKMCNF